MQFFLILITALSVFFLTPQEAFAATNFGKACPLGQTRYQEGGDCEKTVPSVHANITQYPLTCQDIPIAKLEGTSLLPIIAGTTVTRTITSDISKAEIGGLGPNFETLGKYSPDSIAQLYAFNGLFDKPISMSKMPREAARTYWRLLSTKEQANAKANYFDLVKNNLFVNNVSISFSNPEKINTGSSNTSTTTSTTLDSKVGANIGYGHISPKFCTETEGKPVTFLVDLNATNLAEFASCYAKASMRIVRIKNFNASTPVSEFAAAGTRFSATFGNDYIVLGNELNSIDVEYSCSTDLAGCGTSYAAQFAAFKSTFTGPNLSAAPLNVGNPINDPVKFLAGAKQAYLDSTFLANNSYQTSGGCAYDAIRCSKDSYKWFSQTIGTSVPVVLTEYGLAPPNDDKDLKKVVQFYSSVPSDVIAITPLIRNVCLQAKGEWLHFNNKGQIVDSEGNIIDPNSCSAFAEAIDANDSISVLDLINKLPPCLRSYPVCDNFVKEYLDLNPVTKSAYDALLPFNFDNIRGYQVLNNIIYKENLPFIKAITDGLNNTKSGLLNALSPQWVIDLKTKNLLTDADNPIGLPANLESPLGAAIVAYAAPYSASNCLVHDNSTYLPSPNTNPSELNNGNVKLSQEIKITVDNVTKEIDPDTGLPRYKFSGSNEGKPVIVLNNPKLEDLNTSIKGPQSLYSLFVPGSSVSPDRDLTAPVGELTADNSDTKVEGKTYEDGKARIARTGGDSQTKLCELRNQWLIPKGLQRKNLNCVDPYQTLINPETPAIYQSPKVNTQINCNQNAPAQTIPGIFSKSVVEDIAKRWLEGQGQNYVNQCYNDVVSRAVAAGINPALALWIWVHESGASNYTAYAHPIQDFGINDSSVENNFEAQISRFLILPKSYKNQYSQCYNNGYSEMENFIRIFFIGPTATDCNPTEKTQDYVNQMRTTWNYVTSLPFPDNPYWP